MPKAAKAYLKLRSSSYTDAAACRTSFASAGLTFSGQIPLGSPKKRVRSKKIFSFQFKEKRRAWHAIAQAMSIKWMLQDEFCECRADLFRTDAS